MTTFFNFQFPESHKIFFCWDADVHPESEIHPASVFKNLKFQPHKIWSYKVEKYHSEGRKRKTYSPHKHKTVIVQKYYEKATSPTPKKQQKRAQTVVR